MDAIFYAEITARILAAGAIIHGFEFLRLAPLTSATGVWRWDDFEAEFGRSNSYLVKVLRFFLKDANFQWTNLFRIAVAVTQLIVPSAFGVAILFLIHLLTMLRWLGTFNGGSDYMTLLVLMLTTFALAFGAGPWASICLWYIAAQAGLSYLKAGWVKFVNPEWRNGLALKGFIQSSSYERDAMTNWIANSNVRRKLASWSVILFELSFPIILVSPKIAIGYLAIGFVFHLGNAYAFGLNRFVWAWLAAYPALYFCSASL